jgi:hypothetical protein
MIIIIIMKKKERMIIIIITKKEERMIIIITMNKNKDRIIIIIILKKITKDEEQNYTTNAVRKPQVSAACCHMCSSRVNKERPVSHRTLANVTHALVRIPTIQRLKSLIEGGGVMFPPRQAPLYTALIIPTVTGGCIGVISVCWHTRCVVIISRRQCSAGRP